MFSRYYLRIKNVSQRKAGQLFIATLSTMAMEEGCIDILIYHLQKSFDLHYFHANSCKQIYIHSENLVNIMLDAKYEQVCKDRTYLTAIYNTQFLVFVFKHYHCRKEYLYYMYHNIFMNFQVAIGQNGFPFFTSKQFVYISRFYNSEIIVNF